MPLNRALIALLLGLPSLFAACDEGVRPHADDSESPSAVADPPRAQRAGNSQGPIATTLSGPPQLTLGELAELRLQIDRRALHDQVPIEVELRLPPEIALEQGAARTTIAAGGDPNTELRFGLRAHARARQQVTVVIDAHGAGFGYHAELPYYADGHVPLPLAPARAATAVRVGRRNFGQSVGISPSSD